MKIVVSLDTRRGAPGKIGDAELHFDASDGPLNGLRLIGFAMWERRTATGTRNVTFPSRQYSVNGYRRVFPLLRPRPRPDGQEFDHAAEARLREAILQAFTELEAAATPAST